MAFQVSDFHDLVRLLQEHPEWQVQLRNLNLLLSEELLALPALVRRLRERIEQLAAQVALLGQPIEEMRVEIDRKFELIEQPFDEIDRRFDAINRRVDLIERRLSSLEYHMERVESDVADLKGWQLEVKYEKNAGAYFGPLLKKIRVVDKTALAECLGEVLSAEEFRDAILIDLVIRGRLKGIEPDPPEVYLYPEDVQRAATRARLISRWGKPTIPVVGGKRLDEQVLQLAGAILGLVSFWREAVAEYTDFQLANGGQ